MSISFHTDFHLNQECLPAAPFGKLRMATALVFDYRHCEKPLLGFEAICLQKMGEIASLAEDSFPAMTICCQADEGSIFSQPCLHNCYKVLRYRSE